MEPSQEHKPGKHIDTSDVASVYCNGASITMSLHDVRIYFAEMSPKEISFDPKKDRPKSTETIASSKVCIIISPEFARNLKDILSSTIIKYESQFGQLRANPVPPIQEKPIK